MRRGTLLLAAMIGAGVIGAATPASAGPAHSGASCVGILTSYEASQLPAGFVGEEITPYAGPGFGGFVAGLAKEHLRTLEACDPG